MGFIDWLMYRRNAPEDIKKLDKQFQGTIRNESPSSNQIREVFIRLFEGIDDSYWFYAKYLLKRLCSKRYNEIAEAVFIGLAEAYETKDWMSNKVWSIDRNWMKEPRLVSDFIMIFTKCNSGCISHDAFSKILTDLAKNRRLEYYIEQGNDEFNLKALEAIESTREIERWYIGDRPYLRTFVNLLYGESERVIKKVLELLEEAPADPTLDSKIMVRYLSWPGIRKDPDVVEIVRKRIVGLGPKAVYSLDPEISRIRLHRNDKWFKKQIALTAAHMTIHFMEPIKGGATMFNPWVLRHRVSYLGDLDDYEEYLTEVLYDILCKSIGIEKALSEEVYASTSRIENMKDAFEKSERIDEVLGILARTGSPILEGILSEYIHWSLGSVLEMARTRIIRASDDHLLRGGLFPKPEEHAKFVANYLEETPAWKPILTYLVVLGNQIGIRIAVDLAEDGLFPGMSRSDYALPKERIYAEEMITDIAYLIAYGNQPKAIAEVLEFAPSIKLSGIIQEAMRNRDGNIE